MSEEVLAELKEINAKVTAILAFINQVSEVVGPMLPPGTLTGASPAPW
jgi:hypothetical protein